MNKHMYTQTYPHVCTRIVTCLPQELEGEIDKIPLSMHHNKK